MDMFEANAKVANMLKAAGRFQILNDSTGRFTLIVNGKTYTDDVYIDTLTYGSGLNHASDVVEYMEVRYDQTCKAVPRP